MALIQCPECKKRLSESAGACPKCGFHLTPEVLQDILAKQKIEQEKLKRNGKIVLGIIAAFFIILISSQVTENILNSMDRNNHGASSAKVDTIEAFTLCKMYIENKLLSPTSASFCSYSDASIQASGNNVGIIGWVDAQNAFGAQLRKKFSCGVQNVDGRLVVTYSDVY